MSFRTHVLLLTFLATFYSIDSNNPTATRMPRLIIKPLVFLTTSATVTHTTPMSPTTPTAKVYSTKSLRSPTIQNKTKNRELSNGPISLAVLSSPQAGREELDMDPCYDPNTGEAVRCLPEFSDVAFNNSFGTTSQCGRPSPSVQCLSNDGDDGHPDENTPTRLSSYKWIHFDENKEFQAYTISSSSSSSLSPPQSLATNTSTKRCFTCNHNDPNTSYPSDHLTDLHNHLKPSCWVSSPKPRTINLTLNLGKKHELTYISVEFCSGSRQPDAAIFWKSLDHGRSWIPIRFFSTNCQAILANPWAFLTPETSVRHHRRRSDGRHHHYKKQLQRNRGDKIFKNKTPKNTTPSFLAISKAIGVSMATGFQPPCSGMLEIKGQPLKLAFRASEGHTEAGSPDPDLNPSLREWITFSDLKLTLYSDQRRTGNDLSSVFHEGHDFIAISDFNVGARCKCNGHASRCIPDEEEDDDDDGGDDDEEEEDDERENEFPIKKSKKFKCACRHNTRGTECELCKALYNDRPWARATSRGAQECTACNCHGHARSCRFNEHLYKASKDYHSGGVCVRCRHNTAGRYCHLCADGYFKTPGKSLSDKKACSPCVCHPIGSTSDLCNRNSGQCPCKRGVGGRTCDRCLEGFHHGNSPVKPCVQIKTSDTSSEKGDLCSTYCKRSWSLTNDFNKQVCRENYIVMQMKVISKKFRVLYSSKQSLKTRTWIRYGVEILNVFNKKQNLQELNLKHLGNQKRFQQYKLEKKLSRSGFGGSRVVLPGSKMSAWTRVEDAKDCSCINLRSGFVYLVAIPANRKRKSWQESVLKNQGTTHKIRVSIPRFRIAGHRHNSDLLRGDVVRYNRHHNVIRWNQQGMDNMTPAPSKIISPYVNDSIPRSNLMLKSKISDRSTTRKTTRKSQMKSTLETASSPKIALARPRDNYFANKRSGFGKTKGHATLLNNSKKSKEKKSKKEMTNVSMNKKSRIRLASDSLVLAWNARETRDLFNNLDCF